MAARWTVFLSAVLSLLAFGEAFVFKANAAGGDNILRSACKAKGMYRRSIPKGETQVDHLTPLGMGLLAEECVGRCCDLGPSGCQYLWVFDKTCFGVSCDDNPTACRPRKVSSSFSLDTVYIEMFYEPLGDVLEKEILNGYEKEGDDREDEGDGREGERGNGREGEESDSPPIANAGRDITIQLPLNEIHLYGNESSDDKNIEGYHWELTSSHFVQPTLEDTNTPILHILDLISGTYEFVLSVIDSAGQISRDGVTVKVVPDDTQTNPPEAALQPTKTSTTNTTKADKLTPNPGETLPANTSTHLLVQGTPLPLAVEEGEETADEDDPYSKRRNALKIAVPVLLSVAFILIISAAIVGLSACFCERNRRRMRRFYRYKRIPETIEKT